jgi:crossover junction endodeoxyribonuclease RuvC
MTTLLSLDLGTTTGWALAKDKEIRSGTMCFKPNHFDSGDCKFTRFKRWLVNLKASYGDIDQIVYEAVRRHNGTIAGQTYGGFMATLQTFGDDHHIPYEGVPVATIKKFTTGDGRASKLDMINAMERKGYRPKDDNEADALALLYWRMGQE